jgi:hypothetical protein
MVGSYFLFGEARPILLVCDGEAGCSFGIRHLGCGIVLDVTW